MTSTQQKKLFKSTQQIEKRRKTALSDGSLAAGTYVIIHSLKGQVELNDRVGKILDWHASKGRYSVEINGRDKAVLLQPQNLDVTLGKGTEVRVSGLKKTPELNGSFGTIIEFLPENCRYRVSLSLQDRPGPAPKTIDILRDNLVPCETQLRVRGSDLVEAMGELSVDDIHALQRQWPQNSEVTVADSLPHGSRQEVSGCNTNELVSVWRGKIAIGAHLFAYKDAPLSLTAEFDTKLEDHIQKMMCLTAEIVETEKARAEILSDLFNRACDLNDAGKLHRAEGAISRFVKEYEASAYLPSIVEFEVRQLPHPEDTLGGCAHMVSTMYDILGHEKDSGSHVQMNNFLYAFHLRLHMYSRAQGPDRQVWSRRLTATAQALYPLLSENGRQGDAVFCFKVVNKMPWAVSDCDVAAEKMMMGGLRLQSQYAGSERIKNSTAMAMRDGQVLKADVVKKKITSVPPLKRCSNCDAQEVTPSEFQSCGGCRNVAYCSKKCQKAHWRQHKLSCGPASD